VKQGKGKGAVTLGEKASLEITGTSIGACIPENTKGERENNSQLETDHKETSLLEEGTSEKKAHDFGL